MSIFINNLENCKLLTHKNCMDGSSTAIAFLIAGGKLENIVFTNPNHEESDEKLRDILDSGASDIIVADCSISHQLAKEIDVAYENLNIVLLDHHKSATPLSEFKWCIIDKDNAASGAMMMFNYLAKNGYYNYITTMPFMAYERFFKLVDDHDRWCKNYPQAEELAILHGIVGQKIFIERFSKPRQGELLTTEEKFLIEVEKQKIKEMIEDKKREVKDFIVTKTIKGKDYRFGFIGGAAKFTSQIADALYQDPALNLDVVVLVSAAAISLRCRKGTDIDLSELAKWNHGGGHKAASGFPLSSLLGTSLIEFVSNNMKLGE